MKKALSIFALAAAPFLAASTQAALPLWNDDPTTIDAKVPQKSCSDKIDGKQFTYTSEFSVLSDKTEWDRVLAGKPASEEKKLYDSYVATATAVITDIWPKAIKEFLPEDMEDQTPSFVRARSAAWKEAEAEITKRTGIKTIVGFEGPPDSTPGCNLK